MNKWLKYFFKKSKAQKGFIYCCKKTVLWVNPDNGHERLEVQWKYGKTKNITTRMKMYGSDYELLACYHVDHLSMRENMIRRDDQIEDDRRHKDSRDEHVDFDISEIVKSYATGKIKWGEYNFRNGVQHIDLETEDGDTNYCENILISTLHF
jgi:hypothetical protein